MQPVVSARLRRLSRAAGYAVTVAFLVTTLAYLIRVKFDPLVRLDENLIVDATGVTRAHPDLRSLLLFWQQISEPLVAYLVVAAPACLLAWRRLGDPARASWAFLTMLVGWLLAIGLKNLVQRARPVLDDPVSQSPGYSFPSGHATNATIIATTLTLLFWPLLSLAARRVAIVAAVLWVVLTCCDRVFLGVHYPTDVAGGVLLGGGLVLASYAGYLGWRPPTVTPVRSETTDALDRRVGPSAESGHR